ncbi:hypothetical protein BKA65DRAFT_478765 [Rhexocercosporidium sp. MPI-PUGE-AT-0058]|nr:hypothetical protein BKA65DRAFT_478765 [Rhexocercosporidium sp. MPI-PUGE-AT-0058]
MTRFPFTIFFLLLLAILTIVSPMPLSPDPYTNTQSQTRLCFCQTRYSGLFCGSRTQDAAGTSGLPAILSGHCEPNYVYRCNGSAVSPARIQVYCGNCVLSRRLWRVWLLLSWWSWWDVGGLSLERDIMDWFAGSCLRDVGDFTVTQLAGPGYTTPNG